MKYHFLYLPLLFVFLLVSCGDTLREDLSEFLNPIKYEDTYDGLSSGSYSWRHEEYDKDGHSEGKKQENTSFSKSRDNDNFSIEKEISYTGNMVIENVESYFYSLAYDRDLDRYRRKISINGADSSYVDVSEDIAIEAFTEIFFTGDEIYRYGGLYYGDYFQINALKSQKYLSLSDNGDTLTFEAEDDNYIDGASVYQKISIDRHGMLIYCKEKMTANETGYYGTEEVEATYFYFDS
jgi:hypothetical protein